MLAGGGAPSLPLPETPIGPMLSNIGNASHPHVHSFDAARQIRVVNFPGDEALHGSGCRRHRARRTRARVAGGSGVTYSWPSGGLRIDSDIQMAGGGLPEGRVSLRQARAGDAMSGVRILRLKPPTDSASP